ncbi:MAG: hypothetical protein ACK5MV_09045 [Aminipila sp.]
MSKSVKDIYSHCFGHICANGVITLMTVKEAVGVYTDTMCKDLKDCGVDADKEEVAEYITEQYNLLKEMQQRDTNLVRM